MAPSAAQTQGYERASKYPKSTKYGRQNLISEHWNSEEQLVLWRKAWADMVNLHLERAGHEERIDHRSHAERGLDEQPTIHEGVVARALEKKEIVSDRCELNRQIKADNDLLRELREQVKKLAQIVKATLPALAEAMENLRKNLLLFCYQLDTVDKSVVLWYNEENAQGCFFMENSYRRHDMSDAMWEILKPYTIGNKGTWGGNAKDTRQFLNGVFWILRTGAPWRDLPRNMLSGILSSGVSVAGETRASGKKCWKR